ncbi:MAG TPA: sigma-70 family RNA polymerase sigma factor [Acidimicrobiales bacterium]|nr:sigma-70 family RNA polymerase sigma factor [Acidimicrobiales bacterium]
MSAYEIYSPEDEEAAFAAVYRAYSQKLLRYCQYRLRDRHEAEDVVQEAFVRAWRTMPATSTESSFYPWLRVVAGNLCTDVLRKRSRSEPMAAIDPGAVDGEMDRIADESDRVLVRQALGRLNDRHRSALMMRESEGLTYDQIAQRTGVTPGTVESLLWRARQALRREFTVLAGREGCLAALPFLPMLLVARLRGAGRRTWIRVARRVPGLDPSSESPLVHVAVAAVAALSVATGVVVTLDQGHRGPGVVVGDQTRAASTTVAPAGTPLAGPPASSTPTSAPATSPPASTAATTPLRGTWTASPTSSVAPSGPAPLRVVSPVMVGHAASDYAYSAPVTVTAGSLTLGASPPAVSTYTQSVTQRVTAPVASITNQIVKEKKP